MHIDPTQYKLKCLKTAACVLLKIGLRTNILVNVLFSSVNMVLSGMSQNDCKQRAIVVKNHFVSSVVKVWVEILFRIGPNIFQNEK